MEGVDEGVGFGQGVVEGEGGAGCAFDAEGRHKWLGAVVAGADGDAELVEEHAGVVVVGRAEVERDDGCLAGSGAVDSDLRQLGGDAVSGVAQQGLLVAGYGLEADGEDVVDGA